MRESPVLHHLFVLFFATLFFFIQGPELVFNFSNHIFDNGDSILNAWILAWNAHALSNSGVSIWDAPIFYPVKNALAFSENLFGNLWITLPIQYLTGNHILASNVLVLASFVLGTYFVFILVRDLTGSYWAGVFAGLIFSFNPYRWAHLPHLQLMPFFWAPLALFFANRFIENLQPRYFYGMLVLTWVQYFSSIYLGVMLLTLLITLFLIHIIVERRGKDRWTYFIEPKLRRLIFIGLGASLLVLLPLGIPYLKTALKWDFFRTLNDNLDYSAEFINFIFPNLYHSSYQWLRNLLIGHIHYDFGETAVFVGTLPLVMSVSVFFFRRKIKNQFTPHQNKIIFRYGLISIIMALLMMGPYFSIFGNHTQIPMPYQLVFRFVPGGSAMRVPTRFVLPFLLSLSVLCGFGLCFLMNSIKNRLVGAKPIGLIFIGLLLLLDYRIVSMEGAYVEPHNKFPPVYNYLNQTNPGEPILELPVDNGMKFKYLHYQTLHWRPSLGGFSGWVTPAFELMRSFTKSCPSTECFRFLQITPAKTIVIHLKGYSSELREKWEAFNLNQYDFFTPKRFGDHIVLERDNSKDVPPCSKLKISKLIFTTDSHGLIAIISFESAGEHKSCKFLTSKEFQIEFFTKSRSGEEFKDIKGWTVPAYILAEASDPVIFTRLAKVTFYNFESMEIKSSILESLTIDRSSMSFLLNQDDLRGKRNEFRPKIVSLAGLAPGKTYRSGSFQLLKAEVLNLGGKHWPDPSTSQELHDSNYSSVYLGIQWHKKNEFSSCKDRQSKPAKEVHIPIPKIVAPNERIRLEKHLRLPNNAGDYVLLVGMLRAGISGSNSTNEYSMKCFDISILPPGTFEGDLSQYFQNPHTQEGENAIEQLKSLKRTGQESMIIEGARKIRSSGGPEAMRFSPADVHLRYKTLEIADAILASQKFKKRRLFWVQRWIYFVIHKIIALGSLFTEPLPLPQR